MRGEGELTFAELLDHLDILGDSGLQALGDTPGMDPIESPVGCIARLTGSVFQISIVFRRLI